MTIALILVALYLAVGVVVAARCVPWQEISLHARFARMTTDAGGAPRSPMADRVFFVLAVLLWPFACRWHRLGAFAARDLTAGEPSGSVGDHGDGHRQPPLSDPFEPWQSAP